MSKALLFFLRYVGFSTLAVLLWIAACEVYRFYLRHRGRRP